MRDNQQLLEQVKTVLNIGHCKLTNKQLSILKYVSENMDQASYLSLRQLCENIGCSQVTILRLCRELGYDSFVAFREAIRHRRSEKERQEELSGTTASAELFTAVLENERKLLDSFISQVKGCDVDMCAKRISEADFVLILGSGMSSFVGQALSFRLTQCSVENTVVDPMKDPRRLNQLLSLLTQKSVVVAISYPMFNTELPQAVRISNMSGAYSIAITSSMDAPVAEIAATTLICPLSDENIYNSFVTPLEMVNLLVHSIIIKMGLTYKDLRLDN
ncbi:MAG: MurR/RpiR family transcriptional regulator [Clostridia bacterium]|nr:MurR/RpiR family transcriptional regulator [Clostridia bacterium]